MASVRAARSSGDRSGASRRLALGSDFTGTAMMRIDTELRAIIQLFAYAGQIANAIAVSVAE